MRFKTFMESNDAASLIKYVMDGSGWEKEDAERDVPWYLNTIDTINKKGGIAYRLIAVNSPEEINTTNLGKSFTLKKEALVDFEYSLERQGEDYLVTVRIPPNGIDKKASIALFKELPYEYEIALSKKPVILSITKYNKFDYL